MDIFVIKIVDADNVHMKLLKEFQKKDIKDSRKWNEHCFSYLMVDRILKEFYQIEDREIIFKGDKPYLKNNNKFFNLSRNEEFVTIAFSESECSINLQKIKEQEINEEVEQKYNELTLKIAEKKLNTQCQKSKSYFFKNYIMSVMSNNKEENFEIYLQSGEIIPRELNR